MSQVEIRTALELAVEAMPGVIPSANIVSSDGSSPSVFTTSTAHGFTTGLNVAVSNHTTLTGNYFVTVLSATTFKLADTRTKTSVATPAGTGGVVKPLLTAWENVAFVALNNVPYQKVNFVFADPVDISMGDSYYQELGYMQITLYYPQQTGPGAAMSRAELIRKTFPRGSSFSNNGITAKVHRTARISQGTPTDESYIVIVKVPFYADIIQ